MRKKSRFMSAVMATILSSALLVGCGASGSTSGQAADQPASSAAAPETNAAVPATEDATVPATEDAAAANLDTSEHVVLTMYCIGDEGGIYAEDHLQKINEILTAKINAEIDPVMVSWGDYKTKLPMVWAGGEAYDLTYTSNWTGYFVEGEKGAFMDITELFPAYAPLTYEIFQEKGYLDAITINDKIYMVPNDKPDYTTFIYNYREDLRKKYNCAEIVDKATLDAYLTALKENEPAMTPFGNNGVDINRYQLFLNEQNWSRPLDSSNGVFVYDLNDPTKVFNVTTTPEYAEYVKESREYYDKGYWSQSVMAETAANRDVFEGGQSGLYLANISNSNTAFMNITSQHPDWEVGYFSSDLLDGEVELVAPSNNGMAVGAYSKNPERALMFIELMYTDNEVYDVIMSGLEGITYEKDAATMTKWIPEGTNAADVALKNLGMGFGSTKYELGSKNDSEKVKALAEEFQAAAIVPQLSGFSINQDNVSAELAAVKSVVDEYKVPLDKGVIDPTEGIEALQSALQNAGEAKLLEEINAQISAYLAK